MKQLKITTKVSKKSLKSNQSGVISNIGISLMILVVFAIIGLTFWALQHRQSSVLVYTPPPVTADTALTAGNSTREVTQDVKVLEAGLKRAEGYKAAANTVLDDAVYTGRDELSKVDVAQQSITDQQTTIIKESNRRIQAMTKAQPNLDHLTASQRPAVEQLLNSEITILNNLKAKVVTTTDNDGIATVQQAINEEYNNYLLAMAQVTLLTWANDQAIMTEKFNKVGGKVQERADQASDSGRNVAAMLTPLNSFQANKQTARDANATVIKLVPTIRPGEKNANRSVLKTYATSLSTAHNELIKGLATAKQLVLDLQALDK